MFEWLGLANAGKRIALDISNKPDDTNRLGAVALCPPYEIIECSRVELDAAHKPNLAIASSSDTPLLRLSAVPSRCRIASDFKR